MPTRRLAALLVLVAVATTAGCGGKDKKADKTGTSTTSAQATTATSPSTATGPTSTTTTPGAGADGGTPVSAPGRTVQQYFNALSKRDMSTACTYMGDAMKTAATNYAKSALKKPAVSTCEVALQEILKPQKDATLAKLRDLQVLKTSTHGNAAAVRVKGAVRNALLTKIAGRWLITGGIFTTP
ncbi:MAG: hypothetical protein QOG15_2314 [Solirubrobacteraceae bacterium]|jgi:hypothetical protein|nr:hypothetical protein [Solirubrobacteraceae bacterium]